MPTRREVLMTTVGAALAARPSPSARLTVSRGVRIFSEDHCLAQESARGYALSLRTEVEAVSEYDGGDAASRVLIFPGLHELSVRMAAQLFKAARGGSWVLIESGVCFSGVRDAQRQAHILSTTLGIPVRDRIVLSATDYVEKGPYVAYRWPRPALIRSFEAITPVDCSEEKVIAKFSGIPVCAKHRIGRGGMIFLGSMLGPGLLAEEPEAQAVLRDLLRSVVD